MSETERRLAAVVDEIVGSYERHGNINHLDGSNLPSRAEVAGLVDELLGLSFPGYFGQEHIDELTSRYFVGERSARLLRGLERLIVRATIEAERDPVSVGETAREYALDLLGAIPGIRHVLASDVQAALVGDPAASSSAEVITSYPGIRAIAVHRLAHHLHARGIPLLPRMMSEIVHGQTGIDIHPGADIGSSFFIDHGTGVVVGETSRIGDRVKLYQGVTLGALSVSDALAAPRTKRHPTLENDVTVYAGATILGGDTVIGHGCIIGGNVWLTQSVEPRTTVMLDKPSLRFVKQNPP